MMWCLNKAQIPEKNKKPGDQKSEYTNIENSLNHYDNLNTDLKSRSVLSTHQSFGELGNNKKYII